MNAYDLIDTEVRRGPTTPSALGHHEVRHRAELVAARRLARRHRLAERVRSVADRLES